MLNELGFLICCSSVTLFVYIVQYICVLGYSCLQHQNREPDGNHHERSILSPSWQAHGFAPLAEYQRHYS